MCTGKNLIFALLLIQLLENSWCMGAQSLTESPSFVFAEMVRRRLEQSVYGSTSSDPKQQKIMATIEPKIVQGISENGFEITKGSKLNLVVDFGGFINGANYEMHRAKMWIFPHKQRANNGSTESNEPNTLELNLLISVTTPSMKGDKRKRISIQWNKTTGCLSVDVSTPIRKLIKQLQLRNETSGSISVQITGVRAPRGGASRQNSTYGQFISDEEACIELGSRRFREPFLSLSYVDYVVRPRTKPVLDEKIPATDGGKLTRRDLQVLYEGETDATGDCSPRDLEVNITEYIETIIYPQKLNIRDCRGSCNNGMIYAHSFFKKSYLGRFDIKEGSGNSAHQNEPCCVPAKLSSIAVVRLESPSVFILESLPDAVVESCRCM